ncbi:hypothetical protein BDZ89DRAFT_963783, partial [Hymenopellis radicata]
MVRATKRIVIDPETCVQVPVHAPFSSKTPDLFVERNIRQDQNGAQVYGSPDILISSDRSRIPISNFSDKPVIISEGEFLAKAHNPRNWLDRAKGKVSSEQEAYARFVKEMVEEQQRSMTDRNNRDLIAAGNQVISSSSDVTSKAHRNASEPDDPSAQEPVEGGPKTAETDPEPTASKEFLTAVDISSNLQPDQQHLIEEVLIRNKNAFGLDGRLGNHDAQVAIRLKPGAEPISLPPFSASPLNREVM